MRLKPSQQSPSPHPAVIYWSSELDWKEGTVTFNHDRSSYLLTSLSGFDKNPKRNVIDSLILADPSFLCRLNILCGMGYYKNTTARVVTHELLKRQSNRRYKINSRGGEKQAQPDFPIGTLAPNII